ncbi:MAG: ABC transporter permease [Candidatus Komeilibacteria bacterium]|nr:ABC transporter permease [Candidatus Komeilibacteria bacterium]
MKTLDILEETYLALSANKIRSFLTTLGIVIGISSVIAMLAIGQGAQSSIQSSIQSIGSNLIIIMPGAQRGPGTTVSAGRGSAKSLTLADAQAISQEVSNLKGVSPEVSGRYQVTAKGTNTNTQVVGVNSAYPDVRNVAVDNGAFISEQNLTTASKVAVIGPTVRDDLFGVDSNPLGQTIRIKQINFTIIGITKAKGGSGFGSQDDMIFIPLTTAQKFLAGDEYVTSISAAAQDAESTATVQQQITDLLLTRHHIASPQLADFNTLNQADIAATASSVAQIFTILLGSVAGISLVVGGIGIMNMMLTTVTERTREIGLRKSIGAKRRDISLQFLIEAVTLTFLGGLLGVILGWLISWGITYFGLIQTKVSPFSVLLAFSVSAAIGIIFGYYPARRAAKLNPIDALRFE